MNTRKFSLRALAAKLFSKRPAPVVLTALHPKPTAARERIRSGIEPLEGRIAPAVLLNGHTLRFHDSDGDAVKVTFSSDIFDLNANPAVLQTTLDAVFKFTAGRAHTGAELPSTDDVKQQLQLIDLSKVPLSIVGGISKSRVAGISVTVTSDTDPLSGVALGDGLASIGALNAGNNWLNTVIIDGDLGKITAGSSTTKVGVGILVAQSIGKFGTATQPALPTPDLHSVILGRVGRLVVFEDVRGDFQVADAAISVNGVNTITQRGTINQITILGSLVGDSTVSAASNNSGRIEAYDIGNVTIGNDPSEGIFGGGGTLSGAITATHAIGSVTVSGSIEGSDSESAGVITAGATIGFVKVGGELKGGAGLRSGSIRSGGSMGDVTIGSVSASHDVIGGSGESSGSIVSGNALGNVHVFGSVKGGGFDAGQIFASGNIQSVIVEGNLEGGTGVSSGEIESLRGLGPILVRGDVMGGDGAGSGVVVAASALSRITVLGDVLGGKGGGSGGIYGGHDPSATVRSLGNVMINGALIGGEGVSSGDILSGGTMASVQIGSSLTAGFAIEGGIGALSGTMYAHGSIENVSTFRGVQGGSGAGSASIQAEGLIRNVTIRGDLAGGTGAESASILSHENASALRPIAGDIGTVTITGTLMGAGQRTGLVEADGILGRATIGAIHGGGGSFSGSLVSGAGFVRPGATASITVAGLVEGGTGDHSGFIQIGGGLASLTVGGLSLAGVRVADDIAALRVNGDVLDSIITARGRVVPSATSDVAIGSVLVTGNVSNSSILAGEDVTGAGVNADAQIGRVRVIGNWTASVLAAGVEQGTDGMFGTSDDRLIPVTNSSQIIAQIASVLVQGSVNGTAASGDHFGFVSQRVGAFSGGGVVLPLTAIGGQRFDVGSNGDTTVREVIPA